MIVIKIASKDLTTRYFVIFWKFFNLVGGLQKSDINRNNKVQATKKVHSKHKNKV